MTKRTSSRRLPVVNVLTESTELELGTNPPPFALSDVKTGEMVSLEDFEGYQVRQMIWHAVLKRTSASSVTLMYENAPSNTGLTIVIC